MNTLLVLASLAAAAAPGAKVAMPDATSVVGYWYGESGHVIQIEHYSPDGTFSIDFRECLPWGTVDHNESGHWRFSGSNFDMTTESIRGRAVYLTSEETTVAYDQATWTRRVNGGDALRVFGPVTSKAVRVTADSKLPGCDLSS